MDGQSFCLTVLEPSAFNYDYGFFGQNATFPSWCRFVQSLPVALFWENKLECLIMKSVWAPRIFYLQVNYDGTTPPFKLISCLPGYALLSPSNDQFLLDISRAPSSQPINMKSWWLLYYVIAIPAAIRRKLGLVFEAG